MEQNVHAFELQERKQPSNIMLDDISGRRMKQEQRDRADLLRIGKVPVLKRSYNFLSITGFTCTVLTTWEAVLSTMNIGLNNGGPAGMIYMYIFAWIGATCVFASLSELSSMAPISAGQYFWVAMLAPKSSQKILSYLTGWMTVIAWQALSASSHFLSGTLIQALLIVSYPNYNFKSWQGTLLAWAVVVFSMTINTIARKLLPRLEGLILVVHILGCFGVFVPVAVLSDHNASVDVWQNFVNNGGWSTQGLSTFVGLLMSIYLFTGVDGAVHMAEEIRNASVVVPNSIMTSTIINGALGLATMITFMYAVKDIDGALNSPTGLDNYVFLDICLQAVGSVGGAVALGVVVNFMLLWSAAANSASASRMLWAFCRDRAVPGWSVFTKLSSRTSLPVYTILLTGTVSGLLALINIGSSTALNDILGVTTSGYYWSYLIAISLLLWRRCTGSIHPPETVPPSDQLINTVGKQLVWGPWRIPGIWGIAVNLTAILYLIVALFWSYWPASKEVTGADMNYNILIFGACVLFATGYYLLVAKGLYTGPVVEIAPDDERVKTELSAVKGRPTLRD